ncbi:MAG: TonB family protein [Gammaproteobacteria bacterium]|nr:TonB family protein [Gammaproteobacteria bacterium]
MGTNQSKQIQQIGVLIILTIALISSVFAYAVTIAPADGNLLKEIDAPLPVYPKKDWDESPKGEVTLMFDVTEDGNVENPCIVSSSLPGKFELYALQAIKEHRYEQLGGSSRYMTGVKKQFSFTLDSNPTVPVKAKYPRPALEQAAEGYVVVRFGVSASGTVRDAKVVGAEPAEFFEAAALDAANKMNFETTRFNPDDKILHKFIFSLNSNPRRAVSAVYPAEARDQLLHGHVIVEFDINEDGEVENPEAIYSDAGVFETAAIVAVSQFVFDPDKPATEMLHKIEFSLDQDYYPLSKVEPEYPEQALLDNIEGYVILQFDISESGSVENPEVLEANPPKIFDQSAKNAAKQFKYSPRYVAGKPTRTEGVKNQIRYIIEGEEGEEDNEPARALYDNSPEAKQKFPVIMPRINMKQFLEDLKGASPEERKKKLDELMSQGTVVRESRPTHRLSIKGNQEDGSVIVEFDVNEKGVVEQPNILEVQGTVLSQEVTQRIIEEVGYYRYEPFVIGDTPVRTDGVRHLIELHFHED